jgi:hypothetical protein
LKFQAEAQVKKAVPLLPEDGDEENQDSLKFSFGDLR